MLQSGFKKLRIGLEYNNAVVNIEVEPYKPVKFLKQRAAQIFFPLNFEIRLSFCNKDLTPYDEINIGEYFKGKGNITIRVFQVIPEGGQHRQSPPKNIGVKSENKSEYICQCKKGLVASYCRECNEFLCKTCRSNV
jgi:hypothetical protein